MRPGLVVEEFDVGPLPPVLDLEEFLQWFGDVVGLHALPPPESMLTDLGVDQLGFIELLVHLERLVAGDAVVGEDIYGSATTVRDLHLYYLTIISQPREV